MARRLLSAASREPLAFAMRPARFVGRFVEGRPLRAIQTGSGSGPAILVFGAIHGNEPAGIAVAHDLLADARHVRSNVWVVSELLPGRLGGAGMERRALAAEFASC